jgi:hypothetical protein
MPQILSSISSIPIEFMLPIKYCNLLNM